MEKYENKLIYGKSVIILVFPIPLRFFCAVFLFSYSYKSMWIEKKKKKNNVRSKNVYFFIKRKDFMFNIIEAIKKYKFRKEFSKINENNRIHMINGYIERRNIIYEDILSTLEKWKKISKDSDKITIPDGDSAKVVNVDYKYIINLYKKQDVSDYINSFISDFNADIEKREIRFLCFSDIVKEGILDVSGKIYSTLSLENKWLLPNIVNLMHHYYCEASSDSYKYNVPECISNNKNFLSREKNVLIFKEIFQVIKDMEIRSKEVASDIDRMYHCKYDTETIVEKINQSIKGVGEIVSFGTREKVKKEYGLFSGVIKNIYEQYKLDISELISSFTNCENINNKSFEEFLSYIRFEYNLSMKYYTLLTNIKEYYDKIRSDEQYDSWFLDKIHTYIFEAEKDYLCSEGNIQDSLIENDVLKYRYGKTKLNKHFCLILLLIIIREAIKNK